MAANKKLAGILCAAAMLLVCQVKADVPALERELTLRFENVPVPSVLQKISEQTGVLFSYQPDLIVPFRPVTIELRNKTVREALSLIFKGKVQYTARKNYIILKQKTEVPAAKKTEVSGYVYDQATDKKLANVTIYDPATLASTTSDDYGFYSISVPATTSSLSINKMNYADTALTVDTTQRPELTNVTISKKPWYRDSVQWKAKMEELQSSSKKLFTNFKNHINVLNVRDTITRDFQVSLLPFVGTNHKMSANVYNRFSFNILGGYARGVRVFELGGLFNLDRENVKGGQIAGLFNVVGDSVAGAQIAGLFNIVGKSKRGFQAAGLMNTNSGEAIGMQAAGLLNINKYSKGFSVAGLGNISDSTKGVLLAGLFNIADNGSATQVAGLFNIAPEADFQLAGLFNCASKVKGVQIAPLNFADSATGVPIGLLSFVKHGVHELELSADEMFYANAAFRTGVPKLYNIISAGYQPGSGGPLWQVGYGVGSSFSISEKFSFEINLTAHHVSKGEMLLAPSQLYRFYPAIQYKVNRKFSIAAGPTFNLYHTDELNDEYAATYSNVVPYYHSENSTADGYNQKAWVGGKISLRFF